MMPFVLGYSFEAVPYLLVFYIPVLRCLDVEIVSILLDHLHHPELTYEFLLIEIIHQIVPVYLAGV